METKNKRERYSAAFKAKVAIDAIKEKETLQQLSVKYKVSAVTIGKWKAEFLSNSALAFSGEAITYISMRKGFMYLTAIIDVASRFVVGWSLSNTLEARVCTDVLDEAIAKYGKPEILNSDQGSQFTCPRWVNKLKAEGIQISMDGKGRAKDNIWIERFWNTIKREYIYLNPADDGLELYRGIKSYMEYYNNRRAHQGIGRIRPCEAYKLNAA